MSCSPAEGVAAGRHRLIAGDCLTALSAMAAETIDVAVTSPPYNIDLRYRAYRDSREEADYLDWMVAICAEVRRVLKPAGSFFLNISGTSSRPWLPFELIVRLRPLFHLQNHITWVKSIAIGEDSSGHYKPINGGRYLNHAHEHIFHLTRDGGVALDRLAVGVPYKDKSNIARRGHAQDRHCRGNTWFIPYETIRSRSADRPHPASFPPRLPEQCILLHGRSRVRTVLDPFMGIGSTGVACRKLGVDFIGFEIDPDYLRTAERMLG